ncbi:hypothetical protein OC842_007323, partial [Tilletia horrida]
MVLLPSCSASEGRIGRQQRKSAPSFAFEEHAPPPPATCVPAPHSRLADHPISIVKIEVQYAADASPTRITWSQVCTSCEQTIDNHSLPELGTNAAEHDMQARFQQGIMAQARPADLASSHLSSRRGDGDDFERAFRNRSTAMLPTELPSRSGL